MYYNIYKAFYFTTVRTIEVEELKYPCYAKKQLICYDDCTRVSMCKRRRSKLPTNRSDASAGKDWDTLPENLLTTPLAIVYGFGIIFMNYLNDIQSEKGNYHVVGANKFHNKFMITSTIGDDKFYATAFSVRDLLLSAMDAYNISEKELLDALQEAIRAMKDKKCI